MNKIILAACFCFAQALFAQNLSSGKLTLHDVADTAVHLKWYQTNTFKTAAVPALFIGYSLTIMKDHGLYSSYDARDYAMKNYPDFHSNADNYLVYVPGVMMYGLDLAGVQGRNNWKNQTVMLAVSHGLNGLLTWSLKEMTNVERPDASNNRSFPSSHTSVSFVMAEVLHQEFKDKTIWISVAGYSLASAVGAMRILNNKHWLSDVVAGAGFGILSVKLTYLLLPKIKKEMFRQDLRGL